MSLTVKRNTVRFYPDPKRIIARFYLPGGEKYAAIIIKNVLKLSEEETNNLLDQILRDFSKRHRNISKIFDNNFIKVLDIIKQFEDEPLSLPLKKKLLIGSYFTQEYSIESAAFFNPSIFEDPDQSDLEEGKKRIIMSFRATG